MIDLHDLALVLDKAFALIFLLYILWFLTAAKIWSEIDIPPIHDYLHYKKLEEKMRPIGYRLSGRRSRGTGNGSAIRHKVAVQKHGRRSNLRDKKV